MNVYKREDYYKESSIEYPHCDTCGFWIKYDKAGIPQTKTKKIFCVMKQELYLLLIQILDYEKNDKNTKSAVALSDNNQLFKTEKYEEFQENHKSLLELFFDKECYEAKSLPMLKSMNDIRFVFIDIKSELHFMSNELVKYKVNVECYSQRSYFGFSWLLQISTEEIYYMIDCLKLQKELYILNDIFMNLEIMKIFHDGENAVLRLFKGFLNFCCKYV
ncbi:exosome component 10-like [Phymastichus coffea]|uniref:exosome component 10-like n=1 Tax=Phymastichus coffea TaxID=108790 RepID=UPI00273B3040|nr:exosome component 10-like [Phymastichus coffea]